MIDNYRLNKNLSFELESYFKKADKYSFNDYTVAYEENSGNIFENNLKINYKFNNYLLNYKFENKIRYKDIYNLHKFSVNRKISKNKSMKLEYNYENMNYENKQYDYKDFKISSLFVSYEMLF